MIRAILTGLTSLLLLSFLVLCTGGLDSMAAPKEPDCDIIYDFGNGQGYEVKTAVAMSMMVTNPDGSYYIDPVTGYYCLDQAKMRAFFTGLSAMYPCQSTSLDFWATRGEYVHVEGGSQTNRYLDTRTEIPYLANAIMTGAKETHVPTWSVGGTYIEVDMGTQNLYYYVNDELKLSTPIVTGNTSNGHGTPAGVNYVNKKMTNTNLVGEDYVSFVYYWLAVVGNSIGIHDATWRSRFGGTIYQTNGSHGCINVPLSNMKELFPMVETGTSVVMFY